MRLPSVNSRSGGRLYRPTPRVGLCRTAGIKGNDAWIAATARASGSTLITFDGVLATRYEAIGMTKLLTK